MAVRAVTSRWQAHCATSRRHPGRYRVQFLRSPIVQAIESGAYSQVVYLRLRIQSAHPCKPWPKHRQRAQVHLEKRLDDGRRRPHTLSEEQLHTMSFETREFSGAMLASLVNAAALRAGRAGREAVTFNDLEQARACDGSTGQGQGSLLAARLVNAAALPGAPGARQAHGCGVCWI